MPEVQHFFSIQSPYKNSLLTLPLFDIKQLINPPFRRTRDFSATSILNIKGAGHCARLLFPSQSQDVFSPLGTRRSWEDDIILNKIKVLSLCLASPRRHGTSTFPRHLSITILLLKIVIYLLKLILHVLLFCKLFLLHYIVHYILLPDQCGLFFNVCFVQTHLFIVC